VEVAGAVVGRLMAAPGSLKVAAAKTASVMTADPPVPPQTSLWARPVLSTT
jgi:hypothetical protein